MPPRQVDRPVDDEPGGAGPGARTIAWSTLALVVASALGASAITADDGQSSVRLGGVLCAVAALAQVALHTRVGARASRLLLAMVPMVVAIDAIVGAVVARHATPVELAVRAVVVATALLLSLSLRSALWSAIALAAGYVIVLAATGPFAGATAFAAALPRPLVLAVLGAATPIVLVLGAALGAGVGERERESRRALADGTRRQTALASLTQLALERADARVLTERAVAAIVAALGVDAVAVFALDAEAQVLERRASVGWPTDGANARLKLGERTLAACILDAGEPIVAADLAAETRFTLPRSLGDHGFVSAAGTVIAGEAQPFGVIVAFAARSWTGDAEVGAFLAGVAHVLTTAFGRLEDDRALHGEAQGATALVRVGRELLATVDTPMLLDRACELTAEVLGADHGQIWLLDHEEDAYVPISGHGFDLATWEAIRALRVPAESMAQLLSRLEQEHAVEVVTETHRHPFLETVLVQFGIARVVVAPLHCGHELIGVQLTGRRTGAAFTPEEVRLAAGIARLASIALANARLVETAEHASQLKSEFLSTMSHELRTPLNVIIGYLDVLADEPATPEHAEILGRVRASSIELLDMIEGTLNLNRIEAGQDIPQLGELAVGELLEELRGEYAVHPRKTEAMLRWQPVYGALLYSDRRRLKIILKNLVGNALKFTPTGEVVVSGESTDRTWTFTVRDTGIGIPATHLPVVFEMFRQVDSSESRSYSGAGLGLYIVKKLLDQLGGTIDVVSEPGRGSTFRVTLPNEPMAVRSAAPAANGATGEPAPEASTYLGGTYGNARRTAEVVHAALPKPPRKQRILYADDLELNRHLLRRFIARHLPDVEFFEASDGAHALAVFEVHRPDLVLLDLRMPKMDGWVAARRLRALEGGQDVPIVAVTVTASPGAEAYALHAGCNEFLTKPISDYSVLLSRIEYWLGRNARTDAPVRDEPVSHGRERRPRGEPSGTDLVCVLCNQPLPTLTAAAHEKRRQLAQSPVARA